VCRDGTTGDSQVRFVLQCVDVLALLLDVLPHDGRRIGVECAENSKTDL
jgi:hypothetical protein